MPLYRGPRASLLGPGVAAAAGPFTPASLPSLFSWYDASQDTVVADGTITTGWTDRSGNGRHFTHATSTDANFQGAKYRTNVFGSMPALQGWGTPANPRSFFRLNAAMPTACTMYLVVKAQSMVAATGVFSTSDTGTDPYFTGPYFLLQSNVDALRTLDSVTFNPVMTLVDTTKYIIRITFNGPGNAQQAWVNNVSKMTAAVANTGSNVWQMLFAGYNGAYQGHIAEMVMCSTVDSGANQTLMETYLNTKWTVY
jgi:hypothetical protein